MKELEFDVVIPSGGRGTRLFPLTRGLIPKPLLPVAEKELIWYSTESLTLPQVNEIILVANHNVEEIESWTKANLKHPFRVHWQRGTGVLDAILVGAAQARMEKLITCNSDEIREGLDIERLLEFHKRSGKLATMAAARTNKLSRHLLLDIRQEDSLVIGSRMQPNEYNRMPNKLGWVFAGLIVMDKRAIELADSNHSTEWFGLLDPLINAGQLVAHKTNITYFNNVNTPIQYHEAEAYFQYKLALVHSLR